MAPQPVLRSFRFDLSVLRQSMRLPRGSVSEGMWVELVASVGTLHLGRLRNNPLELPFRFNDWVVVDLLGDDLIPGDRRSHGIPVLVYSGRRSLARVTRDVLPLVRQLTRIASRASEAIRRSLACACCGRDNALRDDSTRRGVWMVTNEAWSKVPAQYARRVLCKPCFKRLTGLDPEDPAIDAFASEKQSQDGSHI